VRRTGPYANSFGAPLVVARYFEIALNHRIGPLETKRDGRHQHATGRPDTRGCSTIADEVPMFMKQRQPPRPNTRALVESPWANLMAASLQHEIGVRDDHAPFGRASWRPDVY